MKYKFAPGFLFSFLTPFYDFVVEQGGLGKSFQQKVLKVAEIKDGQRVLDLGCGSGTFLMMVKKSYPDCKVIGVDPDKKMLSLAKNKGLDDSELVQSLAEELPFRASQFNVVVSSLTFHHLPTEIKKQTLKEIYRVLKDGGRFLLADIGKQSSLFWKIKFLLDPERLLITREYMKDNLEGKIPSFLEEAGFKVQKIGQIYQGVEFLLAKKL